MDGRRPTYDHDKIKQLILEHKTLAEISREIGCSRRVVDNVRYKIRRGKL